MCVRERVFGGGGMGGALAEPLAHSPSKADDSANAGQEIGPI